MTPGICRSCQAHIVWIKRMDGKAHPCEVGERIGYTADGSLMRIHESHFAHCVLMLLQHRKKRAGDGEIQ